MDITTHSPAKTAKKAHQSFLKHHDALREAEGVARSGVPRPRAPSVTPRRSLRGLQQFLGVASPEMRAPAVAGMPGPSGSRIPVSARASGKKPPRRETPRTLIRRLQDVTGSEASTDTDDEEDEGQEAPAQARADLLEDESLAVSSPDVSFEDLADEIAVLSEEVNPTDDDHHVLRGLPCVGNERSGPSDPQEADRPFGAFGKGRASEQRESPLCEEAIREKEDASCHTIGEVISALPSGADGRASEDGAALAAAMLEAPSGEDREVGAVTSAEVVVAPEAPCPQALCDVTGAVALGGKRPSDTGGRPRLLSLQTSVSESNSAGTSGGDAFAWDFDEQELADLRARTASCDSLAAEAAVILEHLGAADGQRDSPEAAAPAEATADVTTPRGSPPPLPKTSGRRALRIVKLKWRSHHFNAGSKASGAGPWQLLGAAQIFLLVLLGLYFCAAYYQQQQQPVAM